MKILKKSLMEMPSPYTVSKINCNNETHIMAATEERGPTYLLSPPNWEPSLAWVGPGGVMGIEQIQGSKLSVAYIAQSFAGFHSEEAVIGLATPQKGIDERWQTDFKVKLPFVHRISIVQVSGQNVIIAATICTGKDNADDWSKPGDIYIIPVSLNTNDSWDIMKLKCPIKKNHGLFKTELHNKQIVYISGEEGIFELVVPDKIESPWIIKKIFEKEVSDLFYYDVDNDGHEDLVLIVRILVL